jgi:energy-coupling factor transport system permease protein
MAFQYVKKDTPLDRMNPLVKLLYMALALLLVVQCTHIEDISILLIWIVVASAWWVVGRVELRSLGFLLKLLSLLFVFLFIVQGLTYRFGDTTVLLKLFDWPYYENGVFIRNYGVFTVGGIMYGLVVALRVIAVVIVIPIFTMTSPMSRISASLSRIHVPQKVIFMFITAMRFVPLVQESMDNIIEAQKIRGFDLDSANMYQKLRRAYIPIITPLLLLMFRRAMDLEVAINARAFGARKDRTYVEDISFKARDYLGSLFVILMFLFCMYLLYFDPTHITWNLLLMLVALVASTVGTVFSFVGVTAVVQSLNTALMGIPVYGVICGFFNQNLLTGYGAVIATLAIVFIIFVLLRRRMKRKKKKVKA